MVRRIVANTELDPEFLEQQKKRLQETHTELTRIREGMEEDEQYRSEEERDFTEHDSGDMAASMHTREVDATIDEQSARRLGDVERALQKIEEGSYGVCDDTGEEISRGRLEAMPEATRTVEAQQRAERDRRPPL